MQAAEDIEKFLKNVSYDDFINGSLVQSAVERKLEIIGEALNRVRKENEEKLYSVKDAHRIIGLRNVIAHGYDIVVPKIIWDAVQHNLPLLKQNIKDLL